MTQPLTDVVSFYAKLFSDHLLSTQLQILVTPVPSFGKKRISKFTNRQDLIDANSASVHLRTLNVYQPWFLDGKVTTALRDELCIDGSFLSRP